MGFVRTAVLLAVAIGWPAAAQTFDTSGNGLLSGSYYFRQVVYQVADGSGSLADEVAVYGSMTFDGNGKYTMNGNFVDGANSSITPFSGVPGTYSISASGFGFISNPVSSATSDAVNGLVSHGIFIGSSTENQLNFNDLFIAAPLASPAPTNASFQGTYSFNYLNFPSLNPTLAYDAQFQMSPDGRGTIGTVNVNGYVGQNGSTAFNVSETGVRYLFSNGAANVTFPNSTSLPIVGSEYLYFSPDGNFVFGGAPNGFDMIVGVKATGATPNFTGLYYQAGIDEDESTIASGYVSPDSYYGSFYALPSGSMIAHQRIIAVLTTGSYDYTVSDKFALNSDGSYDDPTGFHHVFGLGGALRIGFGKGPFLGLNVALQAPSFSGAGVYLNPTGVQSAASSALFTAGIAPGEFILLNGTGLASSTVASSAFPTSLGGVQVLINNQPAPLYVVSPTVIQALVPYATAPNSFASIQVINNTVASNTLTALTSLTAPGVFTVPPGGIGYAAAQHAADYSLITTSHPAHIGETIIVYGTGLGAVTPAINDGGVGPSGPLSSASNAISVFIDGQAATVGFAGLTPTAIGLYQLNVTVPAGVRSQDVYLDVSGPDFYTSQALLSVGAGGSVVSPRRAGLGRPRLSGASIHRTLPK